MTNEKNLKKRKKKKRQDRLLLACVILFLLLAGMLLLLLLPSENAQAEKDDAVHSIFSVFTPVPKIADGVTVSGIDLSGMTEEKAMDALSAGLPGEPTRTDFVLFVGNERLILSPADTGVRWDVSDAVEKAFSGSSKQITAELKTDKNKVIDKLQAFFDSIGGIYVPSGFWVDGEMPNVAEHALPCQTIVMNQGSAGYQIDLQDLYDQIFEGYITGKYQLSIPELGEIKEPKPFDLETVYEQVLVPAVDPDIDRKTLEFIPGRDGYGINKEKAAALLEAAKPGETVRMEMEYLPPALSPDDVWYQDTLGYCKTEHTDNDDRNENLRLACAKLNGLILQPGDVFSYNLTLGQRTREAGYRPAPAYSGVELVNEIGGGICQVSSTLYLSALFAELTIVERKNHGFPANYIPLGLDATVNWGTTDLKIRNDYTLPVKILAEIDDGYVKVRIMGVEQRDYYVKMEYRVDDHPSYAAAFRCRYDLETDEQIYRSLDHTSTYLEEVWCWPGYAENATDD